MRSAITSQLNTLRQLGECINECEDGEATLLLGDFHRVLDQSAWDAFTSKTFGDCICIIAEFLSHRFSHDFDETVSPRIAFTDQVFNDTANVVQAIADVCRVLARKLNDFCRVPNDVVLTDFLKPERLDAHRSTTDLGVPQEESGGECLAVDFRPTSGVDQEGEHVLLAAVQSGTCVVHRLLRRSEVRCEFLNDVKQVSVPQSRVGYSMNGADLIVVRQQLQRLLRCRQRFFQCLACCLVAQSIDRVLADTGHLAELAERPVVE